jgi:alkylation response protein AidB-like acyl-CoA dehydrogenase
MTALVQVALAETVAEAEEIQEMLREAGIEPELETAVDHHPSETDDAPVKVLVPESELEAARDAIEAMTEPEDFDADA